MKTGIILATALLPTVGHLALFEFAETFVLNEQIDHLHIIISSRSFEPIAGIKRIDAFRNTRLGLNKKITFHNHFDDDAPQNPATPEEWQYWKDVCTKRAGNDIRYFFASEAYGKAMADLLGADFVPFDIGRRIYNVKGTTTRKSMNASQILPEFLRHNIKMGFVMFGQESTGKTTMTRKIYEALNIKYRGDAIMTHEFARPYLEAMDDKTVTADKMETIANGQYALETSAFMANHSLVTVKDTDLLSTIGYYRIYQGEEPEFINGLYGEVEHYEDNFYFVMNDEIPFEEDALRYGGKVRESTKQFWIDLLDEYGCSYYIVKETDRTKQFHEIRDVIFERMDKKLKPIIDFVRD